MIWFPFLPLFYRLRVVLYSETAKPADGTSRLVIQSTIPELTIHSKVLVDQHAKPRDHETALVAKKLKKKRLMACIAIHILWELNCLSSALFLLI